MRSVYPRPVKTRVPDVGREYNIKHTPLRATGELDTAPMYQDILICWQVSPLASGEISRFAESRLPDIHHCIS